MSIDVKIIANNAIAFNCCATKSTGLSVKKDQNGTAINELPKLMAESGFKNGNSTVYLLMDTQKKLIYVGETESPIKRLTTHLRQKKWWDTALAFTSYHYSHDDRARKYMEAFLIQKLEQKNNYTLMNERAQPVISHENKCTVAEMKVWEHLFSYVASYVLKYHNIDDFIDYAFPVEYNKSDKPSWWNAGAGDIAVTPSNSGYYKDRKTYAQHNEIAELTDAMKNNSDVHHEVTINRIGSFAFDSDEIIAILNFCKKNVEFIDVLEREANFTYDGLHRICNNKYIIHGWDENYDPIDIEFLYGSERLFLENLENIVIKYEHYFTLSKKLAQDSYENVLTTGIAISRTPLYVTVGEDSKVCLVSVRPFDAGNDDKAPESFPIASDDYHAGDEPDLNSFYEPDIKAPSSLPQKNMSFSEETPARHKPVKQDKSSKYDDIIDSFTKMFGSLSSLFKNRNQ